MTHTITKQPTCSRRQKTQIKIAYSFTKMSKVSCNCETAFAIVTSSKRPHKNGQYPPHNIALTMVIKSYALTMLWKQPQKMADIDIKQPISSKNTENDQFPITIACHHCLSLLPLPLPLPINIIPLLLPLPFIVTLHHHLSPSPHHHRPVPIAHHCEYYCHICPWPLPVTITCCCWPSLWVPFFYCEDGSMWTGAGKWERGDMTMEHGDGSMQMWQWSNFFLVVLSKKNDYMI